MAIKNYSTKKETKKEEVKFEVIKEFGVISNSECKAPKELRLISWNGDDPKYDIRGWYIDKEGNEKMTKGITLDAEEMQCLLELLKDLDDEGDDEL